MSEPQPAFGLPAFSSTAFAPSKFNFTSWNSLPDLKANGPSLTSTQAQAQQDDNNPNAKYMKLFQKIKCHNLDPSGIVSEDLRALKIAPLFSSPVHTHMEQSSASGKKSPTQYGVLGLITGEEAPASADERLLFSNTEEPWSAFICGSQGSGKSHTLSCLLENNLLPEPAIGTLETPLTGLVFHYDKFANFGKGQACEAAYLCAASNGGVPVQVLVAPTSLKRMISQYHNLPGLPEGCTRPKVLPLYFTEQQLSVDTMMTLMAVADDETAKPLYINAIRQLLRDIAMDTQDSPGFNYHDFRQRLACLALTEGQSGPLMLRLQLLQSFLLGEQQTTGTQAAFSDTWTFRPGTLTIIDLSDQFVNETDACALFSICLKLFMADWQSNPRIIALDEAHKFMTTSIEANKLTNDLISIIRQQRHMSARVVVATQEPTISETFLDLCNVSIIHRFNSPKWFRTLSQHLAGACVDKEERDAMFRDIVKLSTGEALVFCPTAVIELDSGKLVPLQDGVVRIHVRDRMSADGGQSIQASSQNLVRMNESLPVMPEYQRFKGDKMPAPGSLAKKVGLKPQHGPPKDNVLATEPSPVVRSTVKSQKAPANQEGQISAPKHEPTSSDEAPSTDTESAGTNESANTERDLDSDLDSDSKFDSLSPVVPRFEQVNLARPPNPPQRKPNLQNNVIGKKKFPVGSQYRKTGISEAQLKRLMREAVIKSLGQKPTVKNPSGYLGEWLKQVSLRCGLPPSYLSQVNLVNCKEANAIDLLRQVVKLYYDNQGVPQKNRSGECRWLRN